MQLYLRVRGSGPTRPFRQLASFQEVRLAAGRGAQVQFVVDSSQLAHTRPDLQLVVDPIDIDVVVGLHAEDDSRRARVEMTGPSRGIDRAQCVHFSPSSVVDAD